MVKKRCYKHVEVHQAQLSIINSNPFYCTQVDMTLTPVQLSCVAGIISPTSQLLLEGSPKLTEKIM